MILEKSYGFPAPMASVAPVSPGRSQHVETHGFHQCQGHDKQMVIVVISGRLCLW